MSLTCDCRSSNAFVLPSFPKRCNEANSMNVWRIKPEEFYILKSHHPQEVLLAQFSLYVHKGGLKPDSFHFYILKKVEAEGTHYTYYMPTKIIGL